jgi:cysteine desulfurase
MDKLMVTNMNVIYLDNNATTRVDSEVMEVMLPFFHDLYGNPSSPHHFGGQVEKHLTVARQRLAILLGCSSKEIFFTSGGTESDNLAIRGVLAARPDQRHIITTTVEHSAILVQCQELERMGYPVTWLGVDRDGQLNLSELDRAIRPDTAVVSVMWANNETGVLFPVDEISAICHTHRVPLHVDGVQAVGKIAIDLQKTPVDLLSLSAHKIHGPKGVGALFVRTGTRIKPIVWGGHQERGRRPGTEPVPLIVGFGKAAELAVERLPDESTTIRALRDRLESGLEQSIPNLRVNGAQSPRLPNTLNVCFKGAEGEAMLLLMDQHGIAVSSGSACLADKLEPSHVLLAMGVPESDAMGAVRFSLSRFTSPGEIEEVLRVLPSLNQKVLALGDHANQSEPQFRLKLSVS